MKLRRFCGTHSSHPYIYSMNMIIEIDNRRDHSLDHSLNFKSIQLGLDCGPYGSAHDWDGKRYGSMETNNLCNCDVGDGTLAEGKPDSQENTTVQYYKSTFV